MAHNMEIASSNMKTHLREQGFDNMSDEATPTTEELEMEVMILEKKLQKFTSELIPKKTLAYSWKIDNIEKKTMHKEFMCESEIFPLGEYNFKAKAIFEVFNGSVFMSLRFINHNNYITKEPIEVQVNPRVTYILKDQRETKDKNDIIRTESYLFSHLLTCNNYYYSSEVLSFKSDLQSIYAMDDSVIIDILIEPISSALFSVSDNGVLMWRINNYQKKKKMEDKYLIEYQLSSYFYTNPNGYRVEIWMKFSRDRALLFYVRLLTGKFDSKLSKSFPHRSTITIFNQSNLNNHWTQSVEKDIKDWPSYCIEFTPLSEIEFGGFLLDDTLLCKVVVEAI